MRLLITTPDAVVADYADIVSVRAEDPTGAFGILPGHAEFLTTLAVSVLAWRHTDGRRGYCAVRRGVLSVHEGEEVAVATREAELGQDLEELEHAVLERFRAELDAEQHARVASLKLQMQAIRHILRALRNGRAPDAGTEFSS